MGLTLYQVSESFQNSLYEPTRRGNRAANTIRLHRNNVRKIIEVLGDLPLCEVKNATAKKFISLLREEGYSAASISSFMTTFKLLVHHPRTEEGERIHNFTYDPEFINAPIINKSEQRTPCATREQIESAIKSDNGQLVLFVALAAASGLRASELMALEIGDIPESDCLDLDKGEIRICKTLKTKSAARTIPLPSFVLVWLRNHIGDRTGKLFVKSQTSIREALDKFNLPSPHAYRRFFVSHRRRVGMPEEILKRIAGHSIGSDVTSLYSKASHDLDWVRAEMEKAGVGFSLTGYEIGSVN